MNVLGVNGLPIGVGRSQTVPTFSKTNIQKNTQHQPPKMNHAIQYFGDFGGCGWWRMHLPQTMINFAKKGVVTGLTKLIPDEHFYADVKSVRLQRQATPQHAQFVDHIKNIGTKYNFKLIYEVDDIIFREDIPDFNKAKSAFDSQEIVDSIVKMMKTCDQVSVSCDFMKNYYLEKLNHDNITVVKNMPSRTWFDGFYSTSDIMKKFDKNKSRPRILYAGSGNHFDVDGLGRDDDFSHVKDAIIRSRKDYQWVFLGSIPTYLHEYVKNGDMEFHNWAVILNYPRMIHDLNINAVVAPLMDCTFNMAKSNIKYLEAACLGIPGVFQDILTYRDAPIRFTDGNNMINKLNKLFDDRKYYAKVSKQSRNFAETLWLDDHINEYEDLFFK